jgi:hypothetical protein
MDHSLFLFVPLVGYTGLWLLASPLFLLYFKLFHIAMDFKHTARMVKQVPAVLAIVTVPVCSFVSFWATTQIYGTAVHRHLTAGQALQVGLVSLAVTIVLDMLITVLGEKIDIRKFPLNLMYLLAYLVIVPAVVVGR